MIESSKIQWTSSTWNPWHGCRWIIIGGESGNNTGKWRYRECYPEWINYAIRQCTNLGVKVFVKQLGTHLSKELKLKDRTEGDISEWPEEFPE